MLCKTGKKNKSEKQERKSENMFLNKKRIVKALVSTAVLTIIVTGLYGCGAEVLKQQYLIVRLIQESMI